MILYFKYGGVSYHLIKIFLKHTRVIFGTIKLDKRQEAKQEETLGRCTFVSVTVTMLTICHLGYRALTENINITFNNGWDFNAVEKWRIWGDHLERSIKSNKKVDRIVHFFSASHRYEVTVRYVMMVLVFYYFVMR